MLERLANVIFFFFYGLAACAFLLSVWGLVTLNFEEFSISLGVAVCLFAVGWSLRYILTGKMDFWGFQKTKNFFKKILVFRRGKDDLNELNPASNKSSKVLGAILKIIGLVLGFFAAGIVVTVLRAVGSAFPIQNMSEESQRNLEATGSIVVFALACWAWIKVYRLISVTNPKKSEILK